MIREIPGPIPAPPDGQALSADEVAYRRAHAKGLYAAAQAGDITTYAGWNEAEVRKHWPELWTLWAQYRRAEDRYHGHLLNTCLRLSLDKTTT